MLEEIKIVENVGHDFAVAEKYIKENPLMY